MPYLRTRRFRDVVLDQPAVWHVFRWLLDVGFGVYRKRKALLRVWIGEGAGSVLDVGCGIGQFADVTSGPYLGIDLSAAYIERARKLNRRANVSFRCLDAAQLATQGERFDTVLLIGILHHLDDAASGALLAALAALTKRHLVVMEAIQEQTNPFGRWIRDNDRGDYIRHRARLFELIQARGFRLLDEHTLYLGPTRTIAALWSPGEPAPRQ